MTIDEGIKNLEYNTKQLEMEIESGIWIKGSVSESSCKQGIALNKQHIEWLKELKELRRIYDCEDYIPKKEDPNCGADMRNDSNLMETEVDGLYLNIPEENEKGQMCETCRYYNNNTYWCSRYNDTTYRPNCSSYQIKEG